MIFVLLGPTLHTPTLYTPRSGPSFGSIEGWSLVFRKCFSPDYKGYTEDILNYSHVLYKVNYILVSLLNTSENDHYIMEDEVKQLSFAYRLVFLCTWSLLSAVIQKANGEQSQFSRSIRK